MTSALETEDAGAQESVSDGATGEEDRPRERWLVRWVRALVDLWRRSLRFRVVTSTLILGLVVVSIISLTMYRSIADGLVDVAGAPGVLRQMTFAPERPGAQVLVDALVAHDITPAIGHTDADAATVTATIGHVVERSGRPALVTHLFNGMPPMHHRAGGPVAAALTSAARGEALVELIADGVHVHAEVVRMVFETVGPQAIVLVSDAMSATASAADATTLSMCALPCCCRE